MTRTLCYYLPSFQLLNMHELGRNNKGRITAAVSKQGIRAIISNCLSNWLHFKRTKRKLSYPKARHVFFFLVFFCFFFLPIVRLSFFVCLSVMHFPFFFGLKRETFWGY